MRLKQDRDHRDLVGDHGIGVRAVGTAARQARRQRQRSPGQAATGLLVFPAGPPRPQRSAGPAVEEEFVSRGIGRTGVADTQQNFRPRGNSPQRRVEDLEPARGVLPTAEHRACPDQDSPKKKDAVDEVCPLPPPHKEYVDPLGVKANRAGGRRRNLYRRDTATAPGVTQVSGRCARRNPRQVRTRPCPKHGLSHPGVVGPLACPRHCGIPPEPRSGSARRGVHRWPGT